MKVLRVLCFLFFPFALPLQGGCGANTAPCGRFSCNLEPPLYLCTGQIYVFGGIAPWLIIDRGDNLFCSTGSLPPETFRAATAISKLPLSAGGGVAYNFSPCCQLFFEADVLYASGKDVGRVGSGETEIELQYCPYRQYSFAAGLRCFTQRLFWNSDFCADRCFDYCCGDRNQPDRRFFTTGCCSYCPAPCGSCASCGARDSCCFGVALYGGFKVGGVYRSRWKVMEENMGSMQAYSPSLSLLVAPHVGIDMTISCCVSLFLQVEASLQPASLRRNQNNPTIEPPGTFLFGPTGPVVTFPVVGGIRMLL